MNFIFVDFETSYLNGRIKEACAISSTNIVLFEYRKNVKHQGMGSVKSPKAFFEEIVKECEKVALVLFFRR
jgi:hypothetical protein